MNKIKIKFFGSDIYTNKIVPELSKLKWAKVVYDDSFDLGLVADYGYIFNSNELKSVKYGYFNFHPSHLPSYRGSTPLQTMIFDDVKDSCVTLIKMNEKIDDGKIIASHPFSIKSFDTTQSLKEKTAIIASKMLDNIYKYICNDIKGKKQNIKNISLTKKLLKNDCKINFTDILETADKKIRACYPNPKAFLLINKTRLIIHKAKLLKNCLKIIHIQKEGKNLISFKDYLSGEPDQSLLDKLKAFCNN